MNAIEANQIRYQGQKKGHYESFYLRANHPSRPLAFWIRYTLFSPKGNPSQALGELWAIFFNGETGKHVAVKKEIPFNLCSFDTSKFFVQIDQSFLQKDKLVGEIKSKDLIRWDLNYHSSKPVLLLFQEKYYPTTFPAAKSLVAAPLACFQGSLQVNDEKISIENWIGSQNHNWGFKHTDWYTLGQVAGFEKHPNSFLEIATAKLKVGPFWLPPFNFIALTHKGKTYSLNGLWTSLSAKTHFQYFAWDFILQDSEIEVRGKIQAKAEDFVALRYYNPPGGIKQCLNTKIASCEIFLKNKKTGLEERLYTKDRALFEILTDDLNHGINIFV